MNATTLGGRSHIFARDVGLGFHMPHERPADGLRPAAGGRSRPSSDVVGLEIRCRRLSGRGSSTGRGLVLTVCISIASTSSHHRASRPFALGHHRPALSKFEASDVEPTRIHRSADATQFLQDAGVSVVPSASWWPSGQSPARCRRTGRRASIPRGCCGTAKMVPCAISPPHM